MDKTCQKGNSSPAKPSTRRSLPSKDEEVVGFKEDVKIIMEKLTRGTKELDVISIFGMAGLGKTTLTRKVYNDPCIVNHFDVLVWCSVSQTYNVRTLLVEILKQITRDKSEIRQDDDIADKVRKSLISKRYLIVLDDIWEVEAWEDLRLSFPTGENGSRVMVTTRVEEVAKQLMHYSDPHPLRFLTVEESWELFKKRVFQDENSCTPDLLEAGLKVAKRCNGLPLVILLIAGVIANMERQAPSWLEVANDLSSYVLGEQSMRAIQSSYDHLEGHLKPPLLYMAYYFPEDSNIPVSNLLEWWMAEEFVHDFDSGDKQEMAAKICLNDLVNRSLVMVSKNRANNSEIKCCMLHDVVREFCLRKLAEENLIQHIISYNPYQPLDYSNEPARSCLFINEDLLKRGIASLMDIHKEKEPNDQRFAEALDFILPPAIIHPSHVVKFRLIRVLKLLETRSSSSFVEALKSTNHLRWLDIQVYDGFDFEWVSHLCHLQTLRVYSCEHIRSRVASFWKMAKLRHVDIREFSFIWEEKDIANFNNSCGAPVLLENLKIFGRYHISTADMNLQFWNRFPNLENFDAWFEEAEIGNTSIPLFPGLYNVPLQSLKFAHTHVSCFEQLLNGEYYPCFNPAHPEEDCLDRSVLSEDRLSSIACLPNLEHLVLRYLYFDDHQTCWDVGDNKFPALKYLKIQYARMSQWHCSEESFPVLETLVLKKCSALEEIPSSFEDIPTLKLIKLIGCNNSLRESALNIKKRVENTTGCDILQVVTLNC